MTANNRVAGPSQEAPAPELVEAGFKTEIADAPYLHQGLNIADMAHVLDLHGRNLIPEEALVPLLEALIAAHEMPADEFPYDPQFGETYNCREKHFSEAIGDHAGWLHAGRPRREAVRVAIRLLLRRMAAELVRDTADFIGALSRRAVEHAETYMPDQTYLQHAQPSTFGHYLLAFTQPAIRDCRRMLGELRSVNLSPGGAGCVNGTRLLDDRNVIAEMLGFDGIIEHTRDAMWQTDVLVSLLSICTSILSNESKLAEDLEIWSSHEFDFVDLAGPYTRSSVLMPQKRNPYALSIIRGASGVLIGRLTGFLSIIKTPSARSDNYIYAYGDVPRAIDQAQRITRLITGTVSTLQVNAHRLEAVLEQGFSQSTDLAEFVMLEAGIDYRTAYYIVGQTVRTVSERGQRGVDITPQDLDAAAVELIGRPLGISAVALRPVLDPRKVVVTRKARGGASPAVVMEMASDTTATATELRHEAQRLLDHFEQAEEAVVSRVRELVAAHFPAKGVRP